MSQVTQTAGTAFEPLTATIAAGQQVSDAIILYGTSAIALETPSVLTSTGLTFQGSIDKGVTFKEIRNNTGVAVSLVVSTDGNYTLGANDFAGYDQIKVVTGSVEPAGATFRLKPYMI
jgi:hypothetical protein